MTPEEEAVFYFHQRMQDIERELRDYLGLALPNANSPCLTCSGNIPQAGHGLGKRCVTCIWQEGAENAFKNNWEG